MSPRGVAVWWILAGTVVYSGCKEQPGGNSFPGSSRSDWKSSAARVNIFYFLNSFFSGYRLNGSAWRASHPFITTSITSPPVELTKLFPSQHFCLIWWIEAISSRQRGANEVKDPVLFLKTCQTETWTGWTSFWWHRAASQTSSSQTRSRRSEELITASKRGKFVRWIVSRSNTSPIWS